jgi:protein tyrosine phosphatase (PTP) superfamily phosphohydrolase (DUF442 family)
VIEEITNFMALSDQLWCGGMPTAAQVRELAGRGVQLVINLAIPDSEGALKDEGALVRSLGMEYVNIPVQWDSPQAGDLETFLDVMVRNAEKRILVHCQANYRATAFVALYRIRRLAWEPAKALESLHRVWNPDEYPTWKEFIAAQITGNAGT